jgi:Tfp pilus assembly protein PilF
VIELKPDYAEAHYLLGTVLKQQGDAEGALREFRETIKHQPGSAEAHLSLGQLLQQRKDSAGAAAAFAEADRLRRKKADAQAATLAVGVGLQRLKGHDAVGAIDRFREAVRLDPENAQAHFQLALALLARGAREEARTHFQQAHRLAPYLQAPESSPP